MSPRIPLPACQRQLALMWFFGGGLVFLLMVVQTLLGKYGNQSERAWSWFLPTILPTLTVIAGALAYDARQPNLDATVDQFAFRSSLGLSIFYLVLVLSTLIFQPFTGKTPLDLMNVSNLWLGPVQGLVGIFLGLFFGSRKT